MIVEMGEDVMSEMEIVNECDCILKNDEGCEKVHVVSEFNDENEILLSYQLTLIFFLSFPPLYFTNSPFHL